MLASQAVALPTVPQYQPLFKHIFKKIAYHVVIMHIYGVQCEISTNAHNVY